MDISEFIRDFSEALPQANTESILPETNFWELEGWSSLAAFSIVIMVYTKYNIIIDNIDMKSCDSIESLFMLIKKKKELQDII